MPGITAKKQPDYDMDGYIKKYGKPDTGKHLPDEFKLPNHITFSNESKYSKSGQEGGKWIESENGSWDFYASPFNLKQYSKEKLKQYFKNFEPNSRLHLPPEIEDKNDSVFKQPSFTLNQQSYIDAFGKDDPLAAFSADRQAELKPLLDLYDDPQSEARKHLLCQFLSSRNQMAPDMVYENFDHAARVYNGGQPIGVTELWNKTRALFIPEDTKPAALPTQAPEKDLSSVMMAGSSLPTDSPNISPDKEKGTPGKTGQALESGTYSMLASMKMLPVLAIDVAKEAAKHRHVSPTAERWGASNTPFYEQKWFMGKNYKPAPEPVNQTRQYFLEGAQQYAKAAEYNRQNYSNGKGVVDSFREDGAAVGAEQLVYAMLENVPQLSAQIIFTLANPFAGPAFMGLSSAGGKYGEVIDDENMSQGDKFANVTMTAGAEFLGEYFFSNPLIRRMLGSAPKSKIVSGLTAGIKRITASAGQEAAGESITQFAENLTDIVTGKDGIEFKNLSSPELTKKLFQGVPDAGLIGGVFGLGFGGMGVMQNRSYADIDLAEAEAKQVTQTRKNEILNKKNPSDQEIAELDEIEATENDPMPAPVLDAFMDAAGMDELQKEATKARRWIMAQNQPIDPEASAERIEAAVKEIGFAGTVNIVENQEALPENIRKEAASRLKGGKFEGAIDDNNHIWFVAGNIRPERAGKVALHEIVGHYGLNGAFGEKLNPLLNQIWSERAGDIRLMMDSFGYDFDYSSEKGKTQAAEEFIARTAESSEKPKWWKEVIAQARTFLRKVMPNMRFTDNDINSLIAKAGRYAKRGGLPNTTITDNEAGSAGRFSNLTLDDDNINGTSDNVKFSAEAQNFSKQLDKLASGKLPPRADLTVCSTPEVLKRVGAKILPMTIRQNTVKKITQDKHDISLEQLKKLPEALRRPLMVFDSKTKADSLVILTSLQDNSGKSIVAAVHLNKRMKHHEVNAIASVYGKDNNNVFVKWIKENKLKYINKKRAVKWAQSTGLQLPGEAFPDDSLNNNINDNNENVKFSAVNNIEEYLNSQKEYEKIKTSIFEKNGKIELSRIIVPEDLRDNGLGTRFMNDLIEYANHKSSTITLTPSKDFGGSIGRLKKFYKNLGFVENKGRNKDYAISQTFYKEPANSDIRFSSKSNAELIRKYAAAVAPQVLRKEIASTSDLREVYPDLSEGQAENVLLAARDLMKKNNKKRDDELFRQWRSDVFPLLDTLEHHFTDGKIRPVHDSKNDISGTWIDFKNGEPSDTAAEMLGMEEQDLIKALNGLTKKQVKAEYNKQYSDKAQKHRYELEALQVRRGEVDQLKKSILKGVKNPQVYQLRKYPEMSDFFEELVTGQTKFKGNDVALARIAALSDPAADSSEMLDRYRILRHVQYLKDSGKAPHDSEAARSYITDYARKFMPTEEQHRILKYLKKENITPASLKNALHEIEAFEMQGSKMQALKKELNSAYTQLSKISRRMVRDHYDRVEVAEDLRTIAKNLPADVRKGELNKMMTLLGKSATASNQYRLKRKIEIGRNDDGSPVYRQKTDARGELRFNKDGKPLYEWQNHPDPKSALDRLVDDAFDVVSKAVERSKKSKAIADIKKTFDWVKIGKTPKGIPEGKLTPDIQITVDKWRAVSQFPPSQIADRKAYLLKILHDPTAFLDETEVVDIDNIEVRNELAALDLFGNLKQKSLEHVKDALQVLDHLVDTGRVLHREQIMEEINNRNIERAEAVDIFSGKKWLMDDSQEAVAENKRKNSILELTKSFKRKNLSVEYFLDNLGSLDHDHELLRIPLFLDLSRDVHRATQEESTRKRWIHENLIENLEKIFNAKGRALDRKLKNLNVFVKDSGVFLYPDSDNPTMTMWLVEAEDLIKSLPEDSADRKKLEDAIRRARMDNKRKVEYTEGEAAALGAGKELPMSKDLALTYWLAWEQLDLREGMKKNHWTNESINQIEKFIGEEGIAMGRYLQKRGDDEHPILDAKYQEIFHIHLQKKIKYFTAVFDTGSKNSIKEPDSFNAVSGFNPGSFISRQAHGEKLRKIGALEIYITHSYQMEHWKAWAAPIKRLRGIFMGKEPRLAIQQYHGRNAYLDSIKKIDHLADGGDRDAITYKAVDYVVKGFVMSKLAFNVGVFVKQLTSLPAYGMDIPMASLMSGSVDFWTNPVKNAKFLWDSTDYLKNRWGEGYNLEVMRLLRDAGKKPTFLNRTIEKGMIMGKIGDIIPVFVGGHAVYKHYYRKLVRDGVHPDAAHKEAMLEFEMATDRTQQSGHVKDLGLYQGGGSFAKVFSLYTTSLRQYYQRMSATSKRALINPNKYGKPAVKSAFIGAVILPVLFQLTSDLMKKGFDYEDYDIEDYLNAIATAPLKGTFLLGGLLSYMGDALIAGNVWRNSDSAPAFSDRQILNQGLAQIQKIAVKRDYDKEDLIKAADQLARGTSSVFAPSTAYSIARREYKRFFKPKKINNYQ